jgi:hypothetical protein
MPDEEWPDGPVVLGVGWKFSEALVCSAAQLTAALGAHRVCSSVDPASYLTAWEPERERTGLSLDPAVKRRDRLSGHGPATAAWNTSREAGGDMVLPGHPRRRSNLRIITLRDVV